MEEENQIEALNNRKVIEYTPEGINLLAPEIGDQRYIAYVRPNDIINLNFDLKTLKVDVVKGDVHIIFPNGSTITLASMAAIGFDDSDAPQLVEVANGNHLSLDEFLNATQVLSYDKAKLILTNRDEYKLTEDSADVIRTASEQEADLEAGNPISGVGDTDIVTKGFPTMFINPNGTIPSDEPYVGTGSFVVSITSSDLPFRLDKANVYPGDVTIEKQPTVSAKVLYGSQMIKNTDINMNSKQYGYYSFDSGLADSDDPTTMLAPNVINQGGSSQNIFINNNSDSMKYVLDLSYGGDVFPNQIKLLLPSSVIDTINIAGIDFNFDSVYVDADGNKVHQINNPNPRGEMQFTISFPENTPRTQFDITYQVQFLNPSTGEEESIDVNQNFVISPLASETDLDAAGNRAMLSSTPNPIDVTTGSGDDVIITGGGLNHVNSNGGNDSVFTGQGNDIVNLGEGDNKIWGSGSVDAIRGGSGNNTIYYNNYKDNIDPSQTYFKDSYYNTYRLAQGTLAYFGLNRTSLSNLITNKQLPNDYAQILNQAAQNGSTFVSKQDGADILNGINNIYLTQNRDVVYLSAESIKAAGKNNGIPNIYGGGAAKGIANKDEIQIYTNYTGDAIIDIANNTVTMDGQQAYKFYDFNSFVGGAGNDTFVVAYQDQFDNTDAYTFKYDGGKGNNTLDFSQMGGNYTILFDANTSTVEKQGASNQKDQFVNIQKVIGTAGDDSYYGSFESNIEYNDQGGNNTLSYAKAKTGVTLDLKNNIVYKAALTSLSEVKPDMQKDIVSGNFTIILSNRDDYVISAEGADYTIDTGFGNDTISYKDLSAAIELTLADPNNATVVATVVKSGGGTDTFSYGNNGGAVNYYGTTFDDTFNLSLGLLGKTLSIYGNGGKDTISYEKAGTFTGNKGVTFNFGESNYVSKESSGSNDYFYDVYNFVGSKGDDRVIFSTIKKLTDISGITIDGSDGTDTVSLINMPDTLPDLPQVKNISAQVKFDNQGTMEIYFGQYQDSASDLTDGNSVFFQNMEGIEGTRNNDILTMSDLTTAINFDGKLGDDVADYRLVSEKLEFLVGSSRNGNVTRGSLKDTVKNTEVFYGGTADNTFYIEDSSSLQGYTFYGNTAAANNTVSYEHSTRGIQVDFKTMQVSRNSGSVTDYLYDITTLIGSSSNDTFYAYEETTAGKTITVNGSNGAQDVIDFSRFTDAANALNITFSDGVSIDAGNINWTLIGIEGIIGTKFDDKITVDGYGSYYIDGGESDGSNGGNTLDYSTMTSSAFNVLVSGATVSVSKNDGQGKVGNDNLSNFQNLFLSDKNDIVHINTIVGAAIETIDGKGGDIDFTNTLGAVGNSIDFASYSKDVEVHITDNGSANETAVNLPDGNINILNFQTITGSQANTTFYIESATIYDGFYLIGASVNGALTTIDFSAITNGITLDFTANNNATISGGVTANNMRLSNIGSIVLTAGDDTVYGANTSFTTNYDGGGGTDTLDYSKLNAGIAIDFATGTIYKDLGRVTKDTYINFESIKGTAQDDTLIISDNTASLNYEVDLGGFIHGNIVEVNLASSVTYTLSTSKLEEGGKEIDISKVLNANILRLGDTDDTAVFDDNFANSAFKDVIDGGGGNNTLDANQLTTGFAFNAATNQAGTFDPAHPPSLITDVTWASFKFTNFTTIKGSGTKGSNFYADFNSVHNYIDATGFGELSYILSTAGVVFNLGAQTVTKGSGNDIRTDNYQGMYYIIGSNYADSFIFDDSLINLGSQYVDDLIIEGHDYNAPSTPNGDEVVFSFTDFKSLNLKQQNSSVIAEFVVGSDTYAPELDYIDKFTFNGANGGAIVNVARDVSNSFIFNATTPVDNIINYESDSLVFNATKGQADRGNGLIDTLVGFTTINYAGSGDALFYGEVSADYTYSASNTPTSARVTYQNMVGTGIVVKFKIPDASGIFADVEKGQNNTDHIGKNISYIMGTAKDDQFVLNDISSLGYDVTIDGYSGKDSVSFDQLRPNGGDFYSSSFGTGFDHYILVNISIYGLTEQDDNFILELADVNTTFQIDGLGGTDKLDYSAVNGYSLVVDFASGYVQRRNVSNNTIVATDYVNNFETVVTADGDDNIILSDKQMLAAGIDAGAGVNTLDLTNLTAPGAGDRTSIDYNKGTVTASYSSGKGTQYLNFQTIKLLGGAKDVVYNYDATDLTKNISFVNDTVSSPDSNFTFSAPSANETFSVDLTSTLGIKVSNNNTVFLNISNIHSFLASNSSGTFNFIANGNQHFVIEGGNTANDSIDYSQVSREIYLTITDIATKASEVRVGDPNDTPDQLKGVEKIILGTGNDTVSIVENSGSGPNGFIIDGGAGEDTISLGGYSAAVTIDFTGGGAGGVVSGYDLQNFERYSLTNYDDTAVMSQTDNILLSGGDGYDTINYSGVGQVNIKMSSPTEYVVNKNNGANIDKIDGFENIILGGGDDTVEYYETGDGNQRDIRIDFSTGMDTLSFARYNGSQDGLNLEIDGTQVTGTFLQDNLTLIDVDIIIGTRSDDVFTFKTLANSSLTSIQGGGGVNTLAFSAGITNDITFDLNNDSIQIAGVTNTVAYTDITGFTAADGNDTFILGDIKSTGEAVQYVIDGGAGTNAVDYSNPNFATGGLEVTYNAIDDIKVEKQGTKGEDTLKNIQSIKGSNRDDKFNLNVLVPGMIISGGGATAIGDTAVLSNIAADIDLHLTAAPGALAMNINNSAAILNDIINVEFNASQKNQVTIGQGDITASNNISFKGNFTLNFDKIGLDSTGNIIVNLIQNFATYTNANGQQTTIAFKNIDGVNLNGDSNDKTSYGSVTVYIDDSTKKFGTIGQVNETDDSSQQSHTILDLTAYKGDTYISFDYAASTGRFAVQVGQGDWSANNRLGTVGQVETLKLGNSNDNILLDITGYSLDSDRMVDAAGNSTADILTLIAESNPTANRSLVLSTNEIQLRNGSPGADPINSGRILRFLNMEQIVVGGVGASTIKNLTINILDNYSGNISSITNTFGDGVLSFRGIDATGDNMLADDASYTASNVELTLLEKQTAVVFAGHSIELSGFSSYYLSENADRIVMERGYFDNLTSTNALSITAGMGVDQADVFILEDGSPTTSNRIVVKAEPGQFLFEDYNQPGSYSATLVGVTTLTLNTPAFLYLSPDKMDYTNYNITLYNPGGVPDLTADGKLGIEIKAAAANTTSISEIDITNNTINFAFTLYTNNTTSHHNMTINNAQVFTIPESLKGDSSLAVYVNGFDQNTKSMYIFLPEMVGSDPNGVHYKLAVDFRRLDSANPAKSIEISVIPGNPDLGTNKYGKAYSPYEVGLVLSNNEQIYFGFQPIGAYHYFYLPNYDLNVHIDQSIDNNRSSTQVTYKAFYGGSANNEVHIDKSAYTANINNEEVTLSASGKAEIHFLFFNFDLITTRSHTNLTIGDSEDSYSMVVDKPTPPTNNNNPDAPEENTFIPRVELSDEKDAITIWGVEDNKIIDTGVGRDNISLLGDATNYSVNQVNEDEVLIDGVYYNTGGSYLVVSDGQGHNMYFLNSDLDSIIMGGGNYYINNNPVNGNSTHSGADQTNNVTDNNDNTNTNDGSNNSNNTTNPGDNDRETWWDTIVSHANNTNSNQPTDISNAYNLLEATFKESQDNIDLVLDNNVITNNNTNTNVGSNYTNAGSITSDTLHDLVDITNVNENYVQKEDVENNYKLSEENSDDPNKTLHDILHKNSSSSGGSW